MSVSGVDQQKRTSTKSRNGCLTCKKKRLKCDEHKPYCHNCLNKKILCGGYATSYKWRLFNDPEEPEIKKRKSVSTSQDEIFKAQSELASILVTGKTLEQIRLQNELIAQGINPSTYLDSSNVNAVDDLGILSLNADLHLSSNADIRSPRLHNSEIRSALFKSPLIRMQLKKIGPPRSLSFSETSPARSPMIRSFSSSEREKNAALHSLARAADVMDRKSLQDPLLSQSISSPLFDNLNNLESKNSLSVGEVDQRIVSPSSMRTLDIVDDLNLTPSLLALINFAFTGNDLNHEKFSLDVDYAPSPILLAEGEIATSATPNPGLPGEFSYHILPLFKSSEAHRSSVDNRVSENEMNRENNGSNGGGIVLRTDAQSPKKWKNGTDQANTAAGPLVMLADSLARTSEQEQLLFLYLTYTCAIMSIKNGPHENPWRTIILPIASDYPCLINSINAMTIFHLAGNNQNKPMSQQLRSRGYQYLRKCIYELARDLSKMKKLGGDDLPTDIALTTCVKLAVTELWDTHVSSGIAHLKGAKNMIQQILAYIKDQQRELVARKKLVRHDSADLQDEYKAFINKKKNEFQKKLVLVTDSEWEKLMEENIDNFLEKSILQRSAHVLAIPDSLQFLFNIWIYFEVLAKMTAESAQEEKGIDLAETITAIAEKARVKKLQKSAAKTQGKLDNESNSEKSEVSPQSIRSDYAHPDSFYFFQDFETVSISNSYIDPLLGCAQLLFLIMGAVADMISKIRKQRATSDSNSQQSPLGRNSLSIITQASKIKKQLSDWVPSVSSQLLTSMKEEVGKTSTWDLASCVATAEAYRYATLLYLHQAVPELPMLSSHEFASKVFILLASVPTSSDLNTIHIFPLLVSSCEAEPGEEREWCIARWAILCEKLWIGNVERAFEVVKEVWERKDEVRAHRSARGEGPPNQLSGLLAAISNNVSSLDDLEGNISSNTHWSSVMRQWGWEVLLG